MGRNIHRLRDRQVRTTIRALADGGNLWIYPKGNARSWIFRYRLNGRSREMGLGPYPDVSLGEARELARECRKLLQTGVDPIEARKAQGRQPQPLTFTQAAARYIRSHRHGWRSRRHTQVWVRSLKTYARPALGNVPVADINTEHALRALRPIWITKNPTAMRLRGRIESVLDWAKAQGHREGENPARWRGHLALLLAKPSGVAQVTHMAALPYEQLPEFIRRLRGVETVAAQALEFLVLTACRSNEVLAARWEEIDAEMATWTVPAERTKARREHRVPLSPRALELLNELPRVGEYVFPGLRYNRPLGHGQMRRVLHRLGYDCTVHGFRSSFRDWASEGTSFSRDACEQSLAHALESKVESAYRRGDLLEKRRKLLEAWARYCADTGTVVQIQRHA